MHVVNKAIAASLPLLPKPLVGRVAARYIAGETLHDAMRVAANLNSRGFRTTIDILGEDIHGADQARQAVETYLALLTEIHRRGIDSTVSVKLTQLGLKLDKTLCRSLADSVVVKAREFENFVRIDMEDSSCTTDTLETYQALRANHENVGVAIQAYLRRTAADVSGLLPADPNLGPNLRPNFPPNFRLCKGVYVEPAAIAFQEMKEINANYLGILELLLRERCYVGIATHDESIVAAAQRLISELAVPPTRYEFQMLLGVNEPLRDRIRTAGHPLRVYVPYGRDWYAYSVRRLRENPRIAGYVLKAMFKH